MDFLERNLAVIEKKSRGLASILAGSAVEPVNVEQAKSGGPTFSFKGQRFHSAYDPKKEAALQVEEILAGKADWVIIFGLGCGHTLLSLIEGGRKKVIVYETSQEILKGVLSAVDLTGALALEDVHLCATVDKLLERVRHIDGMEDIVTLQTAPYKKVFPAELKDFLGRINNAHTTNRVSIITEAESCLMWNENYLANVKSFPKYPKIDVFKDAFKGVPMVIAGAGPSLKKNAHLLKDIKGKALIIAAVTAYKPLLSYGVIPDFVIAAEKVDLPEYFTYDERDLQTRFILGEVSHPDMFSREVKNKIVYFSRFNRLSHEQAHLWGSGFFPSSGGSVTTSAFAIGLMCGCDPIVFVGQDLSFGSDGRTHAAGGVYISQDVKIDEKTGLVTIDERFVSPALKEESLKNNVKLLWLKGLDGRPVASKFDWVTFHQWFEKEMICLKEAADPTRVINATEGGALIEGMEHITLQEAASRYMTSRLPLEAMIETAEASARQPDFDGLVSSFNGMEKTLKEIKKFATRIIRDTKRLKWRYESAGLSPGLLSDVAGIQRVEKRLFDRASGAQFIWEALIAFTYRLKYLNKVKDSAEDVKTDFAEELGNMEASYARIIDACDRFLPKLKEAMRSIEELDDDITTEIQKEALNAGCIS
ncbi:MAG: 6-hydroxymethylpterin diphosphokinase MptE-like protein [Deltaproteobacteria bacterium]